MDMIADQEAPKGIDDFSCPVVSLKSLKVMK